MNASILMSLLLHATAAQAVTGDEMATGNVDTKAVETKGMTVPIRVALTDLSVDGVEPRLTKVMNESLLVELRKLARVSVIGMDEIRAMLDFEADKQMLGCDAEESCLAEVTDALGADVLVLGSMARVGDQHIFGLRRIDQRSATVVERVSRVFPAGQGEEFLAAVGPAVEQLFPDRPLRPNAKRGVSVEIAQRLNPPPLRPWVFWTAASLSAGSALVAGTAATLGVWGQAEHQILAQKARGEVVDGASLQAQRSLSETSYSVALTLAVGAALSALSAGVMYFFTDWQYEREDLKTGSR